MAQATMGEATVVENEAPVAGEPAVLEADELAVPGSAPGTDEPAIPDADELMALSAALEARAAFYETLSSLFFRPLTQERVDAMADADFSAYADLSADMADGFNDMTRYLRKRNTGTRNELAADFTGAFVGTKAYEGKVAVPYESVFTSEEGLMYQQGYQEVFAAFKSQAVKKREGLDWPDDHISFMCEFMALLSRRAKEALKTGDAAEALRNLEESLTFLDRHILSWYEDFVALAEKILTTRFYRGVLKVARGFFALDRATLQDMIDELGPSAA